MLLTITAGKKIAQQQVPCETTGNVDSTHLALPAGLMFITPRVVSCVYAFMSSTEESADVHDHIPVPDSEESVPPDQTPEEILEEFEAVSGTGCDLSAAQITNVSEHDLQFRIDREITAVESHQTRTISYPDYQSGVSVRIPFEDRYRKIPERVMELYDAIDETDTGWGDGSESSGLGFRQTSGCTPERCSRCDGTGQKDCRDCDHRGREPCPRCSTSSVSKSGCVECSNCSGNGTVECSNCNSWGKVRNEDFEKETCPKCNGEADWTCDHCGGNGRQPCPNHCDDGKVTCRNCGGTQEVNCGKCDTSGKVVRVTQGDITYNFSEGLYTTSDVPVDPELLLAIDMECVTVDGDVKELPGEDELLDGGTPRSDPVTVADVTLRFQAPLVHIQYEHGGSEYELYKVGDLIFFDRIPTANPGQIRNVTIATAAAITLGTVLLFTGPELVTLIEGVIG